MKKYLLILGLLTVFAFQLCSQNDPIKNIDKIELNDGSIIKGEIVERNSDELSFRIIGGPVVTIKIDQIKEIIEGEESDEFKEYIYFPNGKYMKVNGHFTSLRLGTTWSSEEATTFRSGGFTLSASHGLHINKYLSVGGGTGVDIYNGTNNNTYTFVPVFLDLRGYPFHNLVAFYYSLNVGYGFGWDLFNSFLENGNFTGGLMIEPSIGMQFASYKKGRFFLEAGYKYQSTKSNYRVVSFIEGTTFFREKIKFIRPVLSLGWTF